MQSKFSRIVVPTDFSDTAQSALSTAAAIGAWYRSALDIVTVVDAAVYAYAGYPFASLAAELSRGAEQALAKLKLPAAAKGLTVSRYVLSGTAAHEIVAHAGRESADLIVIGTHGRGTVGRILLGGTADRVLHTASCPVIVTKAAGASPRKAKGVTRVLFPTDFSDCANQALKRAIAITEDFDAELYVLHIVDDSIITTHVQKEREIILKELRNHALEQMKQSLPPELLQNFETTGAVKRGEPGKAIASYAETHGCDLIIMGSHGRTGLNRVLLGSVADKVVRLAKCPVLVERAK